VFESDQVAVGDDGKGGGYVHQTENACHGLTREEHWNWNGKSFITFEKQKERGLV
jgi:hypothetical protein